MRLILIFNGFFSPPSPSSNPEPGFPGLSKSPSNPSCLPACVPNLPLKCAGSRGTFSQVTHTFECLLADMNSGYHMHVHIPYNIACRESVQPRSQYSPRPRKCREPRCGPLAPLERVEACFVHLATLPTCYLHGSCFNPHPHPFIFALMTLVYPLL